MVTKSTTKKYRIFRKKYTRKNKYGGVESETVNFPTVNVPTINVPPTVKMPDYYSQKLNIVLEPKSEVSSTTVSPEIIIPSIIDKDLFNKALASNVDVLIEKSLDMNYFSYFLEKQQLKEKGVQKQKVEQQQKVEQSVQQQKEEQKKNITPYIDDIPKAFETSNLTDQGIRVGGSKYFTGLDEPNLVTKWSNIFKKYKELINLFSSDQTGHLRRRTEIDRFNLFLEMMSFYHDTKEVEFVTITESRRNLIFVLNEYYTAAIPEGDLNINFIDTFSQITINEERVSEYFVRFVLFNNSVNGLFVSGSKRIPNLDPPPVKVNIFKMDESLTASTEYMERTLTDQLPNIQIVWSDSFKPDNFFTQFRTNDWNQDYITNNFFRDGVNTGDNISVLVRSTILYIISKIFNNTNVEIFINSTTINNSRELETKLFEAFPNVSTYFLYLISKNFFPIIYEEYYEEERDADGDVIHVLLNNNTELIEQQQIVKNFLTSSRTKTNNEVALPYNIFLNLYNRDGDTKYITNIPDNIINSSALNFVNDLELFLTLNKYLTETTITQIRQIQEQRANITNTQNIYNTTNDTNSLPIECIVVSGHINPSIQQRSLIPDFLQRKPIQGPLQGRVIEANLHKEPLTVQESAFDFQSNLTSSLPIFDSTPSRIVPVDCKLQTHIEYLGGIPNATIDCQRACLMSQLVYEPSKVVRLFDFRGCWGHDENLVPPEPPEPPLVGKGLKYLCPYQPDYGYGKYTHDITAESNPINRFNNIPYVKNEEKDNLDLMNYNYVQHRCHVWIDDHLKRVYVVFRGTISSYDWWYTDRTIAQGLGFQEGRLLQIKEILRNVYRQLAEYSGSGGINDPRKKYKLIFAGHSLGGFLSIMSAAVVFNNGVFNYPNTFQKATSITFNPWFPPETTGKQGVLDFYVPIINYGTTCALSFGICQDGAQQTIIPSCSTNSNQFTGCIPLLLSPAHYLGKVKGPFYYYLVKSWASLQLLSLYQCHSIDNFYGADIKRKLFDFTTDYISLYNDLSRNINKKYNYLDMLFPELNNSANNRNCSINPFVQPRSALDCGVNVRTNIVLGGNYRVPPLPDIPFVPGKIALDWSINKSIVTVTVDPLNATLVREFGGKKIKRTSKKIRKRRSKRTTKKLRRY